MNWFWTLLPDEALPLVIAGAGLALLIGIITRKVAFHFIGMILLSLLLAPFIESFMSEIPLPITLLIMVLLGLSLLRGIASIFLGKEAASHLVGSLAADAVRLVLKALFLPFRLLWWCLREGSNRH